MPSVEERASSRLPPEDNAYTHETGWNLRMCPPLPDDGDEEARNGVLVAWDKANRTMDNLIKRAQELVREQNYFGEEWQFEALDRLRSNLPEDGTNFNRDTFMAKFMIQTHLVCLDMVSEMTRGEAKAPAYRRAHEDDRVVSTFRRWWSTCASSCVTVCRCCTRASRCWTTTEISRLAKTWRN